VGFEEEKWDQESVIAILTDPDFWTRTYRVTKNEDGLLVIDLNKPLDQEKK